MLRLFTLVLMSFIAISLSFARAQSLQESMNRLLDSGDTKALLRVLCRPIMEADTDLDLPEDLIDFLFMPIDPGTPNTSCTEFGDFPIIQAEIVPSYTVESPSLGTDLLERKNKWRWRAVDGKKIVTIVVINPYPAALDSILIDYANGDCPSVDPERFEVSFSRLIEARETVIVRFRFPVTDLASSGCLDIVAATIKPMADEEQVLDSILPLARAGEWQDAVLLAEAIAKSSDSIPLNVLGELQTTILAGVRPLPAGDSIRNFLGYAALGALDRSNPEYARKLERYRAASVLHREAKVAMALAHNLPFADPSEVFASLSSMQTRAQREEAWARLQEKTMSVTGKVSDVLPAGLILGPRIVLDVASGNQAICHLKDLLSRTVTSIRLGSVLTCTGKILEYTLILDMVSVSVGDAEFKQ